ncbi:MAG: 30S ribosomal protein S20 [bacterium ADurb.Bin400]|nr:MAG: 30S ribosomal protein S20 [bacterium ADurb.Bin400]
MPLTSSAKKALSVSVRRKKENDLARAQVKNAVKSTRIGIKNTDSKISENLSVAYKELDEAAKKNVIHKNKASRLKSRLAKAALRAGLSPFSTTPAAKKPTTKKSAKAKSE